MNEQKRYPIAGLICRALVVCMIGGCGPGSGSDTGTDDDSVTALGDGIDETADSAVVGAALLAEIEALLPGESARIVGALRAETGPQGSFVGYALDDGTRAYLLGDTDDNGNLTPTGAVLEDDLGQLIMMQHSRGAATTITYATGDALTLEVLDIGLRVTFTLNGTVPPSTIVLDLDDAGNAAVVDDATVIYDEYNSAYNLERITLERQVQVPDFRITLQTNVEEECPAIQFISLAIESVCLLVDTIKAAVSGAAIDAACLLAQNLLDGVRGSSPLPGGSGGPELLPKAIAAGKTAVTFGCAALDELQKAGKLLTSLASPDIVCVVYSLIDDGFRLGTTDGRNLPQVLCDAMSTPPIGTGCTNTCATANNGICEDGADLSRASTCLFGTDCSDCGLREVPECTNTCASAENGICEQGFGCDLGSDCLDCDGPTFVGSCNDRCELSSNGVCEDGFTGSTDGFCDFGTDCTDCGPRDPSDDPRDAQQDCSDDGVCNLECPNFEPDIDCTNDALCAAKGLCCPGDGICDIQSCNDLESDCTNADVCDRLGFCCDDDGTCTGAASGVTCPSTDTDCARCGDADGTCIQDCSPDDPDCSAAALGTVTGGVRDADTGDAIPNATVSVLGTTISTTTDADGDFLIANVPVGLQDIVASAADFADGSASVTVSADASIDTVITLTRLDDDGPCVTETHWVLSLANNYILRAGCDTRDAILTSGNHSGDIAFPVTARFSATDVDMLMSIIGGTPPLHETNYTLTQDDLTQTHTPGDTLTIPGILTCPARVDGVEISYTLDYEVSLTDDCDKILGTTTIRLTCCHPGLICPECD